MTETGAAAKLANIPVVRQTINGITRHTTVRRWLGIHPDADMPQYRSTSARQQLESDPNLYRESTAKVAIFSTCYSDRVVPEHVLDLAKVLAHNGIGVISMGKEDCCGMPKLELGDLKTVAALKDKNIRRLKDLVD